MLTTTSIAKAAPKSKKYKKYDRDGLYLEVSPAGGRFFRYDFRLGGKRKTLTIGRFPETNLADARDKLLDARKLVRLGEDPCALKKARKTALNASSANSFKHVANDWFQHKMIDKSESYRERTHRILNKDLFPELGHLPIDKITPAEMLRVLRRIEERTIDIAHRAKQTAGQVFRYAIVSGKAKSDPTRDLQDALKSRRVKHHAAITDPGEFGRFLNAIDGYQGTQVVKTALQLSALVFQRSGEIRLMEWSEINWDARRWELPAQKMKMKREHIVPLSDQAISLLVTLRPLTGDGKYVFPSARGRSRPLSDNGLRTAIRTLGYDNETMTPHGFRATARTILDEVLGYSVDLIEHQLAHAVRDATGRAYNRTTHVLKRKDMMQHWADYLDELRAKK
ncbi:integrase arm-type DNA-binding domain-containing protein [Luminiphilus sp.]|nr:integrase arm-type DNA-binding domain-containing protein [Luminiphilus sp.]